MSNVIEQIGSIKDAVKDLEIALELLAQLKSLKVQGVPAFDDIVRTIEHAAEHVKVVVIDFKHLEELAGEEFVVIKQAFEAHAAQAAK